MIQSILSIVLFLLALLSQDPQYVVYQPALSEVSEQVRVIMTQEQNSRTVVPTPTDAPFDIQRPGNCLVAESQCNTCHRTEGGVFVCTLAYCANEQFVCTQHGIGQSNTTQKKNSGGEHIVRETDMAPVSVQEKAKNFLARRLGVTVDQLTYLRSEEQVWSDTSLGCPEDGYVYATVETPGYTIAFTYGRQGHTVHTNSTGTVFALCDG